MFSDLTVYELTFSSYKKDSQDLRKALKIPSVIFKIKENVFIVGISLQVKAFNKILSRSYSNYCISTIHKKDKSRYPEDIKEKIETLYAN